MCCVLCAHTLVGKGRRAHRGRELMWKNVELSVFLARIYLLIKSEIHCFGIFRIDILWSFELFDTGLQT